MRPRESEEAFGAAAEYQGSNAIGKNQTNRLDSVSPSMLTVQIALTSGRVRGFLPPSNAAIATTAGCSLIQF